VSFIRTGLREIGLKVRRQKTRMALRHEKRVLQKSEINLGREGCSQAANFPEMRNEIVALKKLEQEQREVATRIGQLEEGIKQIEGQRQENAKEQNAALGKLEEEKKPLLQRRNEAKAAAEVCDRELGSVDKRLRENEATDRDLLKQLSDLQAQTPPPADLETKSAGITARRARLPGEREEISRARVGSADACRSAKETLDAAQAELDVAEKNIARVRGEFEARDRALNENSRTQQDAIREARAHHQTVEERKNPAYLNIGRHLASQGIAPPNAPHLLKEVQRHREGVERHLAHSSELALLSSQIDKQELRQFYFSIVSVLVLLAIILPLVFQTPARREWLPRETEAIVSLKIEQFERDELPKRWRKDRAAVWPNLWSSLLGNAAKTPAMNLSSDVARVTRAMTTRTPGAIQEFVLVEARSEFLLPLRSLERDQSFQRRTISGLPFWQKNGLAVARVGPRIIAVGGPAEVEELVQVRLGLEQDLNITGQLFDRFQALDQESTVRLISRDPPNLIRIFQPLFAPELLDSTQLLGLSLALKSPAKARLLLRAKTSAEAADLARRLHDEPQRWLHLQNSDLLLYEQTPEITRQNQDLELRFNVPENSAFLLLERLGKTSAGGEATASL
jgi:hypothetical protein